MLEISFENLTPLMRQYSELKSKYSDCILFFRLGDFYEMFYDDAILASRILNITLTSRNKDENIPLCGVPHHSAQAYLKRLLDAGYKVAICEQLEDPAKVKGIVKRDVVRVLTPGTLTDLDVLEPKENNFLMAVAFSSNNSGISFADVSTGELFASEISNDVDAIIEEVREISPKEIVLSKEYQDSELVNKISENLPGVMLSFVDPAMFLLKNSMKIILEHFKVNSLYSLGLEDKPGAIAALGVCLYYLSETQKGNIGNMISLKIYSSGEFMIIDEATRRNLEIFTNMFKGTRDGSLIDVIDKTLTPMGGRLLRKWLSFPLQNKNEIITRQDAIEEICGSQLLRTNIRNELGNINDIERLLTKAINGSLTPRDVLALRESIKSALKLKDLLKSFSSTLLLAIRKEIGDPEKILDFLSSVITDDPPVHIKDGGVIREGFNKELDELRSIAREGQKWIARLESEERRKTGISSLKVGYNRVFGYYIEVTRPNLHLVPQNYIRKQSLANAERFITEELKEFEEKVLAASDSIIELETSIFNEVRNTIVASYSYLKNMSNGIATLDLLSTLAEIAVIENYCRPRFTENCLIKIKEGRHPVIEKFIQKENFVPNDIFLNTDENQILVITGPNMAGKSTVIRQVGIIVLLAHIGSFVPAREAEMGIIDRIFARVGAMDELARGRSTFMVEMHETAYILRQATKNSLILLDEIGRGTSTFDGISIAWAVAEYIHDCIRAMTLFATHYHELTELALTKERIKNFTISVREWNDKIIFLRKLVPGGANRSFGIQVGKLAGLPDEVVRRAQEILKNLEKGEYDYAGRPRIAKKAQQSAEQSAQMTLFSGGESNIIEELNELNTDTITPLEALNIINRWKKKLS